MIYRGVNGCMMQEGQCAAIVIVEGILHERCWHCSMARHWAPNGEITKRTPERRTKNLCPRNGC